MQVFEDFIDNFLNITTPNKGQLNDGGDVHFCFLMMMTFDMIKKLFGP